MILSVTDPERSLPEIRRMLAWFSEVSFYKANESKSYMLDLGIEKSSKNHITSNFPYVWAKDSITYLGIQLTPTTKALFAANFLPI